MDEIRNSEITVIEQNIKELKNKTALNMLRIGDELNKAKNIVPFGYWETWLAEHVEISARTARYLMKASQTFTEEKRRALAGLDVTKIYYLAELPDDTRDSFIAENDIAGMTTRQLKTAIAEAAKDESAPDQAGNAPEGFALALNKIRQIIETSEDIEELLDAEKVLYDMLEIDLAALQTLEQNFPELRTAKTARAIASLYEVLEQKPIRGQKC